MEIYSILEIIIAILFSWYFIKLEIQVTPYFQKQYSAYKRRQKHRRNRNRTPEEVQRASLKLKSDN